MWAESQVRTYEHPINPIMSQEHGYWFSYRTYMHLEIPPKLLMNPRVFRTRKVVLESLTALACIQRYHGLGKWKESSTSSEYRLTFFCY